MSSCSCLKPDPRCFAVLHPKVVIVTQEKWLVEILPGEPVSLGARLALASRLDGVLQYLPLAAERAGEDVEYVHQLRVATRRARAAVRVFESLLGRKQRRWLTRQLRQLRRAANDARDLDVLLQRLLELPPEIDLTGRIELVGELAHRRRKAQQPLRAAYEQFELATFQRHMQRLGKSIRCREKGDEPSFAQAAQQSLRPLVDHFFQVASEDLTTPESLHQLRIAGKQVRYGLELLAAAFDSQLLESIYPEFQEAQGRLGLVNDYVTARLLYEHWLPIVGPKAQALLHRLLAHEQLALAQACSAFHDWWTVERRTSLQTGFDRLCPPITAAAATSAS